MSAPSASFDLEPLLATTDQSVLSAREAKSLGERHDLNRQIGPMDRGTTRPFHSQSNRGDERAGLRPSEPRLRAGAWRSRILLIDRKKQEVRREQLTESIGLLKVLAPRGGLVLLQKDLAGNRVMVGETRWPGFVLMTMPDTSSMKARVQFLEADAGMVKAGQPATVVVDSHPHEVFAAIVERIDAIARPLGKDSPVKYFETVLRIDDVDAEVLAPGKFMRAEITTAAHPLAITVPRIAVVEDDGAHGVWVDGDTGVERRAVQVGVGDATHLIVTSGCRTDPGHRQASGSSAMDWDAKREWSCVQPVNTGAATARAMGIQQSGSSDGRSAALCRNRGLTVAETLRTCETTSPRYPGLQAGRTAPTWRAPQRHVARTRQEPARPPCRPARDPADA